MAAAAAAAVAGAGAGSGGGGGSGKPPSTGGGGGGGGGGGLAIEGDLVVAGGGVPTQGAEVRVKLRGLPPSADAFDVDLLLDGGVVEGGVEGVGERGAGDVAFLIPPGVGGPHTLQFTYRGGGGRPQTTPGVTYSYAPPVITDIEPRADGAGNVWYAVGGSNFGRSGAVVRVDGAPLPSTCVKHAPDAPHASLLLVDLPAGAALASVTVSAGGVASAPYDARSGAPVVARAYPTRFPSAATRPPAATPWQLVIDGLRLDGSDVQVVLVDHGVEADAVQPAPSGRRLTCSMPPRPPTAAAGEACAVIVLTPSGASEPFLVTYGDAPSAAAATGGGGGAPGGHPASSPVLLSTPPASAPPPPPPPQPQSLPPVTHTPPAPPAPTLPPAPVPAIAVASTYIAPPMSSSGMRRAGASGTGAAAAASSNAPAISSPLAASAGSAAAVLPHTPSTQPPPPPLTPASAAGGSPWRASATPGAPTPPGGSGVSGVPSSAPVAARGFGAPGAGVPRQSSMTLTPLGGGAGGARIGGARAGVASAAPVSGLRRGLVASGRPASVATGFGGGGGGGGGDGASPGMQSPGSVPLSPASTTPLPASEWAADTPACQICTRGFTLARRRHHCRVCGNCVCNDCSPLKLRLDPAKPGVRACARCYARNEAYGDVEDVVARVATMRQKYGGPIVEILRHRLAVTLSLPPSALAATGSGAPLFLGDDGVSYAADDDSVYPLHAAAFPPLAAAASAAAPADAADGGGTAAAARFLAAAGGIPSQ